MKAAVGRRLPFRPIRDEVGHRLQHLLAELVAPPS